MDNHIFIVAEIGCNHNGSKELALKMIDEAKKCGVDAVKFQTFNSTALISQYAPKAEYQKETTGTADSQLEMTKKLELSHDEFVELSNYARELGLITFSTPFDLESIEFLESFGQTIWKIPSGEITNLPYLEKIGSIKCDNKLVILSTGMSTIEEIRKCIDILVEFGTKSNQIMLLHCNTEYPTPDCDVNILAINNLKKEFPNMKIGFSDHSVGYTAAIGASSLGISLIEKHFTLDRNFPGPDHKASIEPEELLTLCKEVRRIEKMLGNGIKFVTKSEEKNKIVARKSIVASRKIHAGEELSEKNITCKRPGNGISPMEWHNIIGKIAEKDFEYDELITVTGINWQEEL